MVDSTSAETVSPEAGSSIDIALYLADQNPHRDRSLGITSMTLGLVRHLVGSGDVRVTQVVSRSSCTADEQARETRCLPFRTDTTVGRLLADGFHGWFVRPDVDLWYYPKGYAPRFGGPDRPAVGTMHDTIVQHYADHYPQARSKNAYRYWIQATRRSLRRLDCVLTVSDHAAGQLRSFCDRYDIPTPRIIVTYEGSSWEEYRDLEFQKRPQVVHLASRMPHKQTRRLLEFWTQLKAAGQDLPELLLIGELDDQAAALADGMRGIKVRPRVPLEELRGAVGESLALLLPSEIEGFGLPAVEAYYVGTPVCFVRGTSVDEILRVGFGDQVDPAGAFELDDVDSFQTALQSVLALPAHEVRSVGDRLQVRYATDRIAGRIVQTFREVMK